MALVGNQPDNREYKPYPTCGNPVSTLRGVPLLRDGVCNECSQPEKRQWNGTTVTDPPVVALAKAYGEFLWLDSCGAGGISDGYKWWARPALDSPVRFLIGE